MVVFMSTQNSLAPHARILIADDDPTVRDLFRNWLGRQPWEVVIAKDGREALDHLCGSDFDVAVLDLKMPHLDGLQVLEAAREQKGAQTDIVLLTGYGTIETAVQAMKAGAQDFLTKPVRMSEVVDTIRRLIERRSLPPHTLLDRMDAFLKSRASDPALRQDDLRKYFKISPRYISKLFKDHVGMSFRERLSHYRVEKARHLIESTNLPMYAVAEQCGFKGYRQLADAFRRHEGLRPREYRKLCSARATQQHGPQHT